VQVKAFARLPVVVGVSINPLTCCPEDVSAKLWLDVGAVLRGDGSGGVQPPAAPGVAGYEAHEVLVED
jgi:hypothetical protein